MLSLIRNFDVLLLQVQLNEDLQDSLLTATKDNGLGYGIALTVLAMACVGLVWFVRLLMKKNDALVLQTMDQMKILNAVNDFMNNELLKKIEDKRLENLQLGIDSIKEKVNILTNEVQKLSMKK